MILPFGLLSLFLTDTKIFTNDHRHNVQEQKSRKNTKNTIIAAKISDILPK